MHRRVTLLAVLGLAALVPAAPAAAKQVVGISVCGANGCVDRTSMLGHQRQDGGLLDIGNVRISDPEPASFVRLKLHIGDGHSKESFGTSTLVVLPARRAALTEDGSWWELPQHAMVQLRPLIRGVQPRPWADLHVAPSPATATAQDARVVEVVPPPAQQPATADDGGLSTGVALGLAAALLAAALAGATVVVTRRRKRTQSESHHGLGETPATG
jgi:hypothetical protein